MWQLTKPLVDAFTGVVVLSKEMRRAGDVPYAYAGQHYYPDAPGHFDEQRRYEQRHMQPSTFARRRPPPPPQLARATYSAAVPYPVAAGVSPFAHFAHAPPPSLDATLPYASRRRPAGPPHFARVATVSPAFFVANQVRLRAHGPEQGQLHAELCEPPLPSGAGGAPRADPTPRSPARPPGAWAASPRSPPSPRSPRSPGGLLETRGVDRRCLVGGGGGGARSPPPAYSASPLASPAAIRNWAYAPPPPPPPRSDSYAYAPRPRAAPPAGSPPATPTRGSESDAGPPPAVGSAVRVHTYPDNDETRPPAWFDATVVRVDAPRRAKARRNARAQSPSPCLAGPPLGDVEVRYRKCGSVDVLSWPADAGDVEVVTAARWDSAALEAWTLPVGKRRRSSPKSPGAAPLDPGAAPDADETRHCLHFALLQLRAEYAEIVCRAGDNAAASSAGAGRCGPGRDAAYAAFDAAARARCAGLGTDPASDLASALPLSEAFLLGKCARGDKWMPWHCALGAHERYLHEVVYRLPRLETDFERYVLGYAFSGSREIELFEALLRPLYEADASEFDAALGYALIHDPRSVLARDSALTARYAAYRASDKKLHTTSYLCHPPRGAAGDEFVHYIVDRTARFALLGARIHGHLVRRLGADFHAWATTRGGAAPPPDRPRGADLQRSLEAALLAEDEIGPTMTKMFLVSTHLAYPGAEILDGSCAVGDGAEAAFDYLYPSLPPRARSAHRAELLTRLAAALDTPEKLDALEPRLRPMLRFVAAAARAAFAGVPAAVLSDGITPYDLQVHLCEWRKFRTKVDRMRLCRRGVVLDPAVAARAVFRKRRKSPAASSGTAVAPYSV